MRRVFFAALVILLQLVNAATAQEKIVNIYNWSDYIDPKVLEDFTKETGIKVVYDTFDANETLEAKMLAGKSGYDVVVPSHTYLKRFIQAGVLQKIDKSKLGNLKYAWPEISQRLANYDPGNEYGVNYMWGTTGLGMNVERVKQRLGDTPLNSWDIVFKPDILGKLRDCGIHIIDTPDEMIPAALYYMGMDPDSKKPADIEKAASLLQKIRPFVRKFHSSEYINGLANGEICLAVGYSGDILQAKARAEEAAKGARKKPVVLDYILPKEGALMWFDSLSIPKDAPHVENAHAFIDYMLRPEIAARNSNANSYANGNLEAQKLMDKEITGNRSVYPDAETMKKLYITSPYPQDVQRVVTRAWTRIKSGR